MDLASVLGLVISFGLIGTALVLGGDPLFFLDLPAALIVFGGTLGAGFISTPMHDALRLPTLLRLVFAEPDQTMGDLLRQFVDLSNRARREGILALEGVVKNLPNPFLRKGLQLTVDGLEPESIREIMEAEIDSLQSRHETGAAIFASMGGFAPAMGLIGTLIGLVQMLQRMNDPSAIGPAMAVALLTTFYGAALANLVFLPMESKLRQRTREEVRLMEMQLDGIIAIAKGENPRIVYEKLSSYQPPRERG